MSRRLLTMKSAVSGAATVAAVISLCLVLAAILTIETTEPQIQKSSFLRIEDPPTSSPKWLLSFPGSGTEVMAEHLRANDAHCGGTCTDCSPQDFLFEDAPSFLKTCPASMQLPVVVVRHPLDVVRARSGDENLYEWCARQDSIIDSQRMGHAWHQALGKVPCATEWVKLIQWYEYVLKLEGLFVVFEEDLGDALYRRINQHWGEASGTVGEVARREEENNVAAGFSERDRAAIRVFLFETAPPVVWKLWESYEF